MRQFVLIVTVLLLVVVIWSQFDTTILETAEPRTIAVEGAGEIEVMPDLIHLYYNVSEINDSEVGAAKAEVDKRSSASVRALIKLGVKEEDITSSALNIRTLDDFNPRDGISGRRHMVQRNIDVVLRDVSVYNAALQALVDSDISEITQIKPDVSNYDQLKQQALAQAAQRAREQAEFLAAQFDAELDRVHQIGRQNIQRHFDFQESVAASMRGAPGKKDTPYDFKPGKVKVTSNVYVEFELR
ncbi:MAG: hypothetical protein CMN85_05100 [Spongiibacteraceae bacterium]|nr:hypothetical protein [Spongiibacteraceae bacterium]|tara:strand:- start:266 stop:994 length:729 start_codon:yes stop_codon:yes gene_type:complete